MAEKQSLKSEGEQLDAVIGELQKDHAVKEISGWESGFPNFSRALDGILPGLYWLIGPTGCGKTSFAKQLLDQVAMQNGVPAIFFSFTEQAKELRIKTLARLSGLDSREIRRGSAYLLHWYGVPRLRGADAGELSPSWERLARAAEQARSWLDLIYIVACGHNTTQETIETQIQGVQQIKARNEVMVVIDDVQRLVPRTEVLGHGSAAIADQLQAMAKELNVPVMAVWPNLDETQQPPAQIWAERVVAADVILVMEPDTERTKKLTEPNQAITIHLVKNRSGERGQLAFNFSPPFSRFVEIVPN